MEWHAINLRGASTWRKQTLLARSFCPPAPEEQEALDRVALLRRQGMSPEDIARELGIPQEKWPN